LIRATGGEEERVVVQDRDDIIACHRSEEGWKTRNLSNALEGFGVGRLHCLARAVPEMIIGPFRSVREKLMIS
jgi:hypothetical protein